MAFVLGLDLGQTTDPTAGVILEGQGDGDERIYLIRHIEEFALGTPYPRIIEAVQALLARPPLQGQCILVIDHTGVGRAIYDMFVEAGLSPVGITITTGKTWHRESWAQYHVAKELLVGTVQKFLQSERIRSSWRVKHSRLLQKELRSFRVKVTKAANEQYGPDVRESAHDDKVLATAIALWYAENDTPAISLAPAEMEAIRCEVEAERAAAGEREEVSRGIGPFTRLWGGGRRPYW